MKEKSPIRSEPPYQKEESFTSAIQQAVAEKPSMPSQEDIATAKPLPTEALKSADETSLSASILLRMKQLEENTDQPEQPAVTTLAPGAQAKEPEFGASEAKYDAKINIAETTNSVDITSAYQPINLFADITDSFDQQLMHFEKSRAGDLVKLETMY